MASRRRAVRQSHHTRGFSAAAAAATVVAVCFDEGEHGDWRALPVLLFLLYLLLLLLLKVIFTDDLDTSMTLLSQNLETET